MPVVTHTHLKFTSYLGRESIYTRKFTSYLYDHFASYFTSKTLLIFSRIFSHLGIFNPIQFGFLEGKSTVTQLLICYNDRASSRNNSTPTDVIFLDFTKAFDSVPHERLLLKLKGYGIEGNLLQWFRNFLTNRQQRVVVRGTFSSWTHARSGVLQGTILGNNPRAHPIPYLC